MYVHNDSLLALNRSSNTFSDVSIRLFPLLPYVALQDTSGIVGLDIGTADFLVTHIHVYLSYNIIGLDKGIVYSRSSRLVPDKLNLGFRYPCDGPGRGGTCQISSWIMYSWSILDVQLRIYSDIPL